MPTSALVRRSRSGVGICLRQIAFVPNAWRSMIAATAGYGGASWAPPLHRSIGAELEESRMYAHIGPRSPQPVGRRNLPPANCVRAERMAIDDRRYGGVRRGVMDAAPTPFPPGRAGPGRRGRCRSCPPSAPESDSRRPPGWRRPPRPGPGRTQRRRSRRGAGPG